MDNEFAKRRSQHITALAERSASSLGADAGLKSPRAGGVTWPWSPRRPAPAAVSTEKGLREGFLMKYPLHGHALSRPRRRFFRLTSHVIEWSAGRGKQIKGHISLHEAELEQLSGERAGPPDVARARSCGSSHPPACSVWGARQARAASRRGVRALSSFHLTSRGAPSLRPAERTLVLLRRGERLVLHGGDLKSWADALRSAIDKLSSTPAILEALLAEQQACRAPCAAAEADVAPTSPAPLRLHVSLAWAERMPRA